MKHRSKKKEAEYRERRKLVARILKERPGCEACRIFARHDKLVAFHQNPAVDLHELVRRSQGGSILDESNIIPVCRPCHSRIGLNPKLAFDLGLARHGWEK